jgi:hypothetical protein
MSSRLVIFIVSLELVIYGDNPAITRPKSPGGPALP